MALRRKKAKDEVSTAQAPEPKKATKRKRRSLHQVIDAAVTIPSAKVHAYVDAVRAKHPDASPDEILEILQRRYLLTVSTTGGAVGAAAAVPGLGTTAALVLTSGQVATFLGSSAVLALAIADVHGIDVEDVPRRRTVLLTALLGPKGPQLLEQQAGISVATWGRTVMTRLPMTTVKSVNKALTKRIVAGSAAKAGSIMLGRLLPFGVGAAIGYSGGHLMGRGMIKGIQGAFGPTPTEFPRAIGAGKIIELPPGRQIDVLGEADGDERS